MNINETDIAVIGMACRTSGAKNIYEFWRNVVNGVESITKYSNDDLIAAGIPKEHIEKENYVKSGLLMDEYDQFDAGFFGFSPKEGSIMDPQHRHFLECSWEALEDAGYVPDNLKTLTGVFAGCGMNNYLFYNVLADKELVKNTGFFLLRHTGNDSDFLPTRVSYLFNLKGPSVNIQTACSTSASAIHYACQSILNGECTMALAGGSTVEVPQVKGYLYEENEISSPDGHCRVFDHNSQGTIFGSGTGVVVLKRLQDAIEDNDNIYAVIKGSAVNNDGAGKVGYLAPSVLGQARAVKNAIELAGVSPDSITYIETHGTGTAIGDPIEFEALTKAFGKVNKKNFCYLGAVKANIGHTDTAAGVLGFIKTVMAIKNKTIPPLTNFEKPNPILNIEESPFIITDKAIEWKSSSPLRAGLNSLGVGGTNVHIILEEAPEILKNEPVRKSYPFKLSAKTNESLKRSVSNYISFLRRNKEIAPASVSFIQTTGRKEFDHSLVGSFNNIHDLLNKLRNSGFNEVKKIADYNPVFVFPGGGAQYPKMTEELYLADENYKKYLDVCFDFLLTNYRIDLKQILFEKNDEEAVERLKDPLYSILTVFIVEYAIAKLLIHYGVKPFALIGHSLGEYTSACISGVITVEEALSMVIIRGNIFKKVPEGRMLSVQLNENDVTDYLCDDISLAVINAENLSVLSGNKNAIESLKEALEVKNIENTLVKINIAAHSYMLDPFLSEYEELLKSIKFKKPEIPYISTATGNWIKYEEILDLKFWVNQLRNSVRFYNSIKTILEKSNCLFIEAGPGNTLVSLISSMQLKGASVVSVVKHPKETMPGYDYFLTSLGYISSLIGSINWKTFWGDAEISKISLPAYSFDHKPYWNGKGAFQDIINNRISKEKIENPDDWFYEENWTRVNIINESIDDPKVLLFFSNDKELIESLSKTISSDTTLITVSNGEKFDILSQHEIIINHSVEDDYEKLFAYLSQNNFLPDKIINTWLLNENIDENDLLINSVYLVRQLGNAINNEVNLQFWGNNVFNPANNAYVNPVKNSFSGSLKVVNNEFEFITAGLIDIGNLNPNDLHSVINLHLTKSCPDYYINDNRLFSREYLKSEMNPGLNNEVFKENGVYIITGGSGGIASYLSKKINSDFNSTVYLIGRNKSFQTTHEKIIYKYCDINDSLSVIEIIRNIYNTHGKINGIFHTAGGFNNSLISALQTDTAADIIQPKINGTLNIIKATEGMNIDFLILFSSVSSFVGVPGQYYYAYANTFLNNLANRYNDQLNIISINWNQWEQIGMAARLTHTEEKGIPLDHDISMSLLENDSSNVLVRINLSKKDWVISEHKTNTGICILPATGFLEILNFVVRECNISSSFEIASIYFLNPLIVEDTESVLLTLTKENNSFSFKFSALINSNQIYCEGIINLSDKPSVSEEHSGYSDNQIFEIEKSYIHPFMDFGDRWDNLKLFRFNNTEAFAEIELNEKYSGDLNKFSLHPSILDIATGYIQTTIAKNLNFVPFYINNIKIFNKLPLKLTSHISGFKLENDLLKYKVEIFDENKNVVVKIEEFCLKAIDTNLLQKSNEVKYDNSQFNKGILPDEGYQELKKILDYEFKGSIIISSQKPAGIIDLYQSYFKNKQKSQKQTSTNTLIQPQTEDEKIVAEIWKEVLGINEVGLEDDFMELGGHSLLLTRAIIKTKKHFGIEIDLNEIFTAPTIRTFVSQIDKSKQSGTNTVSTGIKKALRENFKVKVAS